MPELTQVITGEKKRITKLERNMAEVNKKLDGIVADVAEIRRCLLGDPEYKIPGIVGEHKEMYKDYNGARWFLKNVWTILSGIVLALIGIIITLVRGKIN